MPMKHRRCLPSLLLFLLLRPHYVKMETCRPQRRRTVVFLCERWSLRRVFFSVPSRLSSMVEAATPTATSTMLVVPRRRSFCVTIKPRRCTIRIRLIVSRTKIMMINTVGTLPIIIRSGIGEGSRVRPIIIVVHSVPKFIRPARLPAGVRYRDRYFDFVLRTFYKHNTDFSDYIKATEDDNNDENKNRIYFKYNTPIYIHLVNYNTNAYYDCIGNLCLSRCVGKASIVCCIHLYHKIPFKPSRLQYN